MIARQPLALLALLLAGCSQPAPAPTPAPMAPVAQAPVILCLGTSLTAGLGLDPSDAWPAKVQEKLDAAGLKYRVVNAGSSGETSAGALRRLDWLLQQKAAVLVIETGANDGLRGLPVTALRENIQAIVDRARQQQPAPKIVLAAMEAPPNYGDAYARDFRAVYTDLAQKNGLVLLRFFLQGGAAMPVLNQGDGSHPTA